GTPSISPSSFHTVSLCHTPPAVVNRRVPPTEMTWGEVAGKLASPKEGLAAHSRYPSSPAEAVITVLGWLKGLAASASVVSPSSGPPQELEISVAPRVSAARSAASRSSNPGVLASTSRILQFWQVAWAVSMSSEISPPQPSASSASLASAPSSSATVRGNGRFAVSPFWLTFSKHPFAVVQAGRPSWREEVLR